MAGSESFSSKRLADYAALMASIIEQDGPVYVPILNRLMREYRFAKAA